MSERSSGPAESSQVGAPQEAEAWPPAEPAAGPAPAPHARDGQPIEVGDGPFSLTDSDDEETGPTPGTRKGPSRTRVIVLGALVAVTVAGAAVVGTTAVRIISQKDASLTAPPEVASLRLDESEGGRQTADYLSTALAAEVDLDDAVGAVYTDGAGADRSVLFFGGTGLVWSPESDLDSAFDLIADDQGAVTGLEDVDAGDLGGTMKCGTTTSADGDIAVCGWADHGSLALAMFPNRSADESAGLLLTIRDAAQTRR